MTQTHLDAPERLRVAQVIGSFEGPGGAQRQAYNLVLGLRELGADSLGIALRRLGDYAEGDAGAGFTELSADRRRPLTVVRAAYRFRRLVSRWRPHVLHVQGNDCLPFVHYCLRGTRGAPAV